LNSTNTTIKDRPQTSNSIIGASQSGHTKSKSQLKKVKGKKSLGGNPAYKHLNGFHCNGYPIVPASQVNVNPAK
jgi:hypothetical protein